jgi:lysozyme
MFEDVKERIKQHEGFNNRVYKDSLGKKTIGYGHLVLPTDSFKDGEYYETSVLNDLFEQDFQNALDQAQQLLDGYNLPDKAIGVVVEMIFQLGMGGVSKFKMMLTALMAQDYDNAANQMLRSEWHEQSPKRCEELSNIMRSCS